MRPNDQIHSPLLYQIAQPLTAGCRLLVERPDGARLALTLPSLDLASITQLCADILRD
jgi:hypothetical protein